MKTIWKFELQPQNPVVWMPIGAQVLTAREQGDKLCIWAVVDSEAQHEIRKFVVIGTGYDASHHNATLVYRGTGMFMGGHLVLHVFEEQQ